MSGGGRRDGGEAIVGDGKGSIQDAHERRSDWVIIGGMV